MRIVKLISVGLLIVMLIPMAAVTSVWSYSVVDILNAVRLAIVDSRDALVAVDIYSHEIIAIKGDDSSLLCGRIVNNTPSPIKVTVAHPFFVTGSQLLYPGQETSLFINAPNSGYYTGQVTAWLGSEFSDLATINYSLSVSFVEPITVLWATEQQGTVINNLLTPVTIELSDNISFEEAVSKVPVVMQKNPHKKGPKSLINQGFRPLLANLLCSRNSWGDCYYAQKSEPRSSNF